MNNTMTYLVYKEDVALFVEDLLHPFAPDFQSITIISQEKLGGYFVRIAIDGSLEDIAKKVEQTYCFERMDI